MEETILNSVAMFGGASALAVTVVPAVFRAFRNWRADPEAHRLKLTVDHETYVFDVRAIDR
jgi:hypothetical protein